MKLVAELEPGLTTEVEVARLERDEQAGLADLGLRLAEAKQLTAALHTEMVPAQVTMVGERRRVCVACGDVPASRALVRNSKHAGFRLARGGRVGPLLRSPDD